MGASLPSADLRLSVTRSEPKSREVRNPKNIFRRETATDLAFSDTPLSGFVGNFRGEVSGGF